MLDEEKKYRNKYRIPSTRLNGYDYAQAGYYFITICTKDRIYWFGNIKNSEMIKSKIGEITDKCWLEIPSHFPFVELDKFIIMPNHIHGIIIINEQQIANNKRRDAKFCVSTEEYKNKFGPQSKNLSSIIRGFKIGVKNFTKQNKIDFAWQGRFYDRIIRNEEELNKIRQYIIDNPIRWELDKNNTENLYM